MGLWIDDNMKWNTNTEKIVKKAAKRLFLLKILKSYGASTTDMKNFYIAAIRPTLEYQEPRYGMEELQRTKVKK